MPQRVSEADVSIINKVFSSLWWKPITRKVRFFSLPSGRFPFKCRKSNWLCIVALDDWKKKLAPLFHPIRRKTKTNRESLTLVFPRFDKLHTSLLLVFIGSPVSFVIGRSNYFFFCLGFTTHSLFVTQYWEITIIYIRTYGKFRLLAPWVNTCWK